MAGVRQVGHHALRPGLGQLQVVLGFSDVVAVAFDHRRGGGVLGHVGSHHRQLLHVLALDRVLVDIELEVEDGAVLLGLRAHRHHHEGTGAATLGAGGGGRAGAGRDIGRRGGRRARPNRITSQAQEARSMSPRCRRRR